MTEWNLSDREQEVLSIMGKLGTAKLVARELHLSHRTVEIYLANVRRKMQVGHTVLAVLAWDRYVFSRSAKHEVAEYSP
jgi:DNA-binding CsgD family transcriptional regulator